MSCAPLLCIALASIKPQQVLSSSGAFLLNREFRRNLLFNKKETRHARPFRFSYIQVKIQVRPIFAQFFFITSPSSVLATILLFRPRYLQQYCSYFRKGHPRQNTDTREESGPSAFRKWPAPCLLRTSRLS